MNRLSRKIACLCALLALIVTSATAALADSDFQATVSADAMKVYSQYEPYEYLGTLPRGTVVTVKAYSSAAALISYNGYMGVAQISDMSPVSQTSTVAQAAEAKQDDQGKAMVATRKTRVYKRASTSSTYVTVKAGESMQVLAVNGNCAKVSYNGKVGYAVYSHLGEPGSAAQAGSVAVETTPEPVAAQTASQTSATVQTGNTPVVTTQSAPVYIDANRVGEYVNVGKGTSLTLLAVRGDCAMVERNGAIGYTSVAVLQSVEKADASKAEAAKLNANPFSSGSNEHAIYAFLTGEMNYNRAAAMGVMANIKYESSYDPDCNGDGGTSYGICQWHAGRKTNLISWCEENGLDYTTLDGQLSFFRHEITTRYPTVHSYLKQVENSAEGAYDAGYYFCFNYEAPAARIAQSTKRGNYARDTLFAK